MIKPRKDWKVTQNKSTLTGLRLAGCHSIRGNSKPKLIYCINVFFFGGNIIERREAKVISLLLIYRFENNVPNDNLVRKDLKF